MIKLKELSDESIEWYFNEIKDDVYSRIMDCISLFEDDKKIITDYDFSSLLTTIKDNIIDFKNKKTNYLIGYNLEKIINLFSTINFQQEFTLPSSLLDKELNISDDNLELLSQINSIYTLFSWESLDNNLPDSLVEEVATKLKNKLETLKKLLTFILKKRSKTENRIK